MQSENDAVLVKVLTALVQIHRCKERTPPETVQLLLDVLAHPDALEESFIGLPWDFYRLVSAIRHSLLLVGTQYADQVIPLLLERLTYLDQCLQDRKSHFRHDVHRIEQEFRSVFDTLLIRQDDDVPDILHALLRFAFQEKPVRANTVPFLLTTTQRAVLTTILTSEVVSYFSEDVTKYLEEWGLPYYWKLERLLL